LALPPPPPVLLVAVLVVAVLVVTVLSRPVPAVAGLLLAPTRMLVLTFMFYP
jgi:hypothetical protein